MNDIEREVIILNSTCEVIDDMVNWAMFVKTDHPEPTNLMFETRRHARLFSILLADFLSQISSFRGDPIPFDLKPVPNGARPSDLTFLFHLRQVCAEPKLGRDTAAFSTSVEAFANWLEVEFTTHGVNFSEIGLVMDLQISRIRYLKMCGDIAKHSLARLATNVGHLRKLMEAAGHSVNEQQAYLAIGNFFEWFHEDIFVYHSSQIAEFLNNIRWSIYDYLKPEFQRSWHRHDDATPQSPLYNYRVPPEITEPIAFAMYWDLMNWSRSPPYMQRFVVSESFKKRY